MSFDINGKHYSNVSVEQTYKGNYHLLADINGKERKFIIGKDSDGEIALFEAMPEGEQ